MQRCADASPLYLQSPRGGHVSAQAGRESPSFRDVELRAIVPPYWREGDYRQELEPRYTVRVRTGSRAHAASTATTICITTPISGGSFSNGGPTWCTSTRNRITLPPRTRSGRRGAWAPRRSSSRGKTSTASIRRRSTSSSSIPYAQIACGAGRHPPGAGSAAPQALLPYPSAVLPQFGVDAELFSPDPRLLADGNDSRV